MSRRSKRLQTLKEAVGQNGRPDPVARPVPTPKPAVAAQAGIMSPEFGTVDKGATCCAPTAADSGPRTAGLSDCSTAVALRFLDLLVVLALSLAADIRNFVVGAPVPPPEGKSRKTRKIPVPACSLLVKSLNQLNKIANDNIRMLVKAEAPEAMIAERRMQAGTLLYDMGNALLDILAAELALIGENPEPPTTDKFIKTLATLSRIVNNAEKMRKKGGKVRYAECGMRNEDPGAISGEASTPELARVQADEAGPEVGAQHVAPVCEPARVQANVEGPAEMDDVDVVDEMDELLLTERADRQ